MTGLLFTGLTILQELLLIITVLTLVCGVIILIWIINKLRIEMSHIRTINALIAEKNGVMIRVQCPECENIFWEDATNKLTVCEYCNTEFEVNESNIITKPNPLKVNNEISESV
jgi:ribosomal protein S27E